MPFRRNMAAHANLRAQLLGRATNSADPRATLTHLLSSLNATNVKGYAKQYREATGVKPYASAMPNMAKAVLIASIVDHEFPGKKKPAARKVAAPKATAAKATAAKATAAKATAAKATAAKVAAPKVAAPKATKKPATRRTAATDKQEAGRLRLISGEGLQRGKKRPAYPALRHGKGPFRYVIVSEGRIIVDAGPVATARSAAVDAKALLRTNSKAFVNPISQMKGRALIAAKATGLEQYGKVVDGYTVENKEGEWEAFIYQPNDPNIAYAGGRGFDRLMPTQRAHLEPLSLKNVPSSFFSESMAANPKRRRNSGGKSGNKYDYLYVLQGQYGQGWEDLSAAPQTPAGWREVREDRRSYQQNEGGSYRIIQRREVK